MRKDKTRVKKAIDIALEQLDYIIDYLDKYKDSIKYKNSIIENTGIA